MYGGERDVSGSCEYRKNAEGKWEKVVVEKPKIKITNRTLIKKKKLNSWLKTMTMRKRKSAER